MELNNLKVFYRDPRELRPYEKNARLHSKAQLKKLKASLMAYGFTTPILIDQHGMVVCGAGRLAAAIELGIETVPTIELSHLNDSDKRAYILADNRIALQSSWSRELLTEELRGLVEIGYNVDLTGFDSLEVDSYLSIGEPEPPEDNVYLGEKGAPITRLDDRWQIGNHVLVCGDARDPVAYDRLLEGQRAQLIFIDPPYGNKIANNVSGLGRVKHDNFLVGSGEQSLPEFAATLLRPAFKLLVSHAAAGAIAFTCIDWRAAPHLLDAAQGVFHELKNLIVWVKTNAGMGTFYRSGHELIYAFKISPGATINNFGLGEGGRSRSNVWTYAGANVFRAGRMQDLADHSTVKPKKLVADAILDCSKRGGIVLDVFAGSGTTLVAAQMTGRRGYGIELDPKYCDVILRRVSEAVGAEPTLDGEPLSAVTTRRRRETGEANDE